MADDQKNEPLRISVEEARARIDAGLAIIVDVDDPGSFKHREQKIAGARRIDPRAIDEDFKKLPEDQAVLAYCT